MIALTADDDWNGVYNKFQSLDVYYTKEYINLYSEYEGGVPEAIYYEDEHMRAFYPFIKRKIPNWPTDIYDTITVGYSGPHIEGNCKRIAQFYDHVSKYFRDNNVVTETIRFHPIHKNHIFFVELMDVRYVRKTIGVELSPSIEEIRRSYSKDKQRSLKKISSLNIQIEQCSSLEQIEIFQNIYYETMERTHAKEEYYYPLSFISGLMECTELCHPYLLMAKIDDEYVAGVLLLIGNHFGHYHLGASKNNYLKMGISIKMVDAMIQFCKEQNLEQIHLGCGIHEDDALFAFKSSFANMLPYHYFLGRKVHNPFIYEQLIAGINRDDEGIDFFPLYRSRPLLKVGDFNE